MTFRRAVKWTALATAILYIALVVYVALWAAVCWNCADNVGNRRSTWVGAVALLYGPFTMFILFVGAFIGLAALFFVFNALRLLSRTARRLRG